uniref:antibiotic biosynthesis monooxygenase family protein n=1 Tax=Trichocoleus desertorum TaxID=1481672 RepID=UPI0025B44A80|nr:antibiotic biosynthesis monooxygenase [Trichocoleus desertorum]
MTDFNDCLNHRIAQVAIGEFHSGTFAEAKRLYDEAVATYGEGFKEAYLLQEQGTDKGISVILWDSEDSMKANVNDAYKSILKKLLPLFVSPPSLRTYEVVSEVRASEGEASRPEASRAEASKV